ncbi:efflux RND transporter periplasmic adaptor subunit [Amphibiibacter pelophylacis]|uniref:Efflux RND transporter periplasmic adaptor subunit n=1 Tax=Amphibiibacter pelophylacis TaxID=1799477 RepID=A0ACC6NYM5_9BURK
MTTPQPSTSSSSNPTHRPSLLQRVLQRPLRLVLVLALVAAAVWGVMAWRGSQTVAPSYVTAKVTRGDIEDTVLATGTLQPSSAVSVGAQVSGQIRTLAVRLGDRVRKGQLLAEIDATSQTNALRTAQANVDSLKAQLAGNANLLEQTRLAYERARTLRQQDATSQADLETARLAWKNAQTSRAQLEAQIRQQQIQVDVAKSNLGYTRITAPMDGTIVTLPVEVGQTVNANQSAPTLMTLAQTDPMTIQAQISEADVSRVQPGATAWFTTLGSEKRIPTTLRSIQPAPDGYTPTSSSTATSATSTQAVYYDGLLDVPNPDGRLRASMTAQVTIVVNSVKDVLTVPSAALQMRGAGAKKSAMVRVLDAAGQAQERRVRIGLNNKVSAQVLDGLKEGDTVVLGEAGKGSSNNRSNRAPRMF